MKYALILVGLFLIIVGASECNQSAPKPKAQLTPADQIFYSQERDSNGVRAQALRVVPGRDWTEEDTDSLSAYGAMFISQNPTNSRESRFTLSTLVDYIGDSVTVSGVTDLETYRVYGIDSLPEIYSSTYAANSIFIRRSTWATYLVQADSTATVDSIAVIPTGSNYAVLQPLNGQYELDWFGATDDNTTDNAAVFTRAANFDSLSDLVIRGDTFFTTDATIPNNLVFAGGKIRNTGTLNIKSMDDPGLRQVFTLTGVQQFTERPEYVRTEWWGMKADSATMFEAPLEAAAESMLPVGGAVIQLAAGKYLMDFGGADIGGYDVTIQGIKGQTYIIAETGGSLNYMLRDVATGSDYYNSFTLKDIIFERSADGGNIYALNMRGERYKELNLIGCTFRHKGMFIDKLEKTLIQDCYFYTEGDFRHSAINVIGSCRDMVIRNCTFRYIEDAITLTATPSYANTDVLIEDCYFDMGWMTGATRYQGHATYPGGAVIEDLSASFDAIDAGTTVRFLDSLSTGTGTFPENNMVLDGSATFVTDGARSYDLVKVGDKYGLIEQVLGETRLQVEFWADSTTRLPVEPPASGAYVVYSLDYGEVTSNTSTAITCDRFWQQDGAAFSPSANTIYEVLYDHGNYAILAQDWNKNITVRGCTVLRGWSDQVSLSGNNHRVIDNLIEWGQDMGITFNDCHNCMASGNIINHQGVGGVWTNSKRNTISNNIIRDMAWENGVNVISQAGILLSGADSCLVTGNTVSSTTTDNQPQWGISVRGSEGKYNFVNNNQFMMDTAIRLYEADSTIIGVNYPNTISDFNSTNTIYSIPNPDGNGIYGSSDALGALTEVDMNGFQLEFVGSTRQVEISSSGALWSRNVSDADENFLVTHDYISFSNTATGAHGAASPRLERTGSSALAITGPSGILLSVIGSSSIAHIDIDGGPNADILISTGDDIIITLGDQLRILNVPEYADDTAAGAGGLVTGDVYRTATGEFRIKL